jgi:hypothetical protein
VHMTVPRFAAHLRLPHELPATVTESSNMTAAAGYIAERASAVAGARVSVRSTCHLQNPHLHKSREQQIWSTTKHGVANEAMRMHTAGRHMQLRCRYSYSIFRIFSQQ